MCLPGMGGGVPADNSGLYARQAEDARQRAIRDAQSRIDQSFSGFNDDYFNKFQKDYTAANGPQVDDQYVKARKALQGGLAQSGNLTSSYGAEEQADLEKTRKTGYQAVGDNAVNAANALRKAVQGNKSSLYSLANTASDPSAAAGQAPAVAAGLDTPVAVSPIGDLFGSFTQLAANSIAAERAGYYGTGTGMFAPPQVPGYQGSSKVVGA